MPLPAQNEVEFGRLATEQRQVAEQLRRLEHLLGVLEERDRKEGRLERAALLKQAAEQLAAAEETGDLAAVVEGLAREIGAMHSGNALEGQQKLIAVLQELLDFLIDNERREQEILQMQSMQERLEALEDFIAEQKQLLEKTQELEKQIGEEKSESEKSDGEKSDGEKSESAEPNEAPPSEDANKAEQPASEEDLEELRKELAELQNELAEKMEEFNREQQKDSGRKSETAEKAQDAAADAAEELREQSAETEPKSPSEQLQEAIAQQQEALKNLEQAKDQAEQQVKQAKEAKRDEILLDVEMEAVRLLALHLEVDEQLQDIAVQVGVNVVPRSARAKLRQAAAAQLELAYAATKMMSTIDNAGADSFPFYINLLAQDHIHLSKAIGPPRYHVKASALQVSQDLTNGWQSLIDAIRTERERIRLQMEQENTPPPGAEGEQGEEEDDSPLVDFALELQLLKRMQSSISEQLILMNNLQEAYLQAGLEMGPEEMADLEQLLERQQSLQLQFESMVARMAGIDEKGEVEDL